jgi:ABC-type multidrug transport system ATPase subunit
MEAMVDIAREAKLAPVPEVPVLRLAAISKSWGPKPVLGEVDVELAPHSLTWLAGPNGAGKTTLLRIACGLLAPDSGDVSLDGLRPMRDRRAYRRRLGFLSAGDRGIYARLTVYRHLHLWARLALLPRAEVEPAIRRVVAQVGLEELLAMRADRLSMGQRQRLRLALTFLHSPDVVLLDEPLSSLDEAGTETLRTCIEDVRRRGGATLWCSPGSDRDQAPFDRHLWLDDGAVSELR